MEVVYLTVKWAKLGTNVGHVLCLFGGIKKAGIGLIMCYPQKLPLWEGERLSQITRRSRHGIF